MPLLYASAGLMFSALRALLSVPNALPSGTVGMGGAEAPLRSAASDELGSGVLPYTGRMCSGTSRVDVGGAGAIASLSAARGASSCCCSLAFSSCIFRISSA